MGPCYFLILYTLPDDWKTKWYDPFLHLWYHYMKYGLCINILTKIKPFPKSKNNLFIEESLY